MSTRRTGPLLSNDQLYRAAMIWLALLSLFVVLKLSEEIAAPLLLALIFGIILAPLCDWFEARGLPRGPAAFGLLATAILAVVAVGLLVEPLIWQAADELPELRWKLRLLVNDIRGALQGIDDVAKGVGEALGTGGGEDKEGPQSMPSMTDALFAAPAILAQVVIFLGATFFFLLTRRDIYRTLSRRIVRPDNAAAALARLDHAERSVSRYFLAVTFVNIGLGAALSVVLLVIGAPAPFFWGICAAVLNYVIYVGPAIVAVGLLAAGILTFSGLSIVLPMGTFLILNLIEAQFVTPLVVGRHISVNPFLIFVSLVFWLWFWGPVGGVIAIPVLVVVLALTDRFVPQSERAS